MSSKSGKKKNDSTTHNEEESKNEEEEEYYEEDVDEAAEISENGMNYLEIKHDDNAYASAVTQTPKSFYKNPKKICDDHELHFCVGVTLLEKYHSIVMNYIENVNVAELSSLRSEICEKIQKRLKFQRITYGAISKCFDEQPLNLYNTFNVSLYLVLYPDHFTFSTVQKGFEISGSIDDETGQSILSYISRGMLKPGLLDSLKNKNLSWYDGCLICEIIDCRRKNTPTIRTQLRVSPYDINQTGIESEQSYVLAQNPFVCTDPSPAVANIARAAMNDRLRWEVTPSQNEAKILSVVTKRPDLFLKNMKTDNTSENHVQITPSQQAEFRRKMIEKMLGIHLQDNNVNENNQ